VDPRASRDLWWLLVLVMTLVGGLVLYAWPHLQIRETARAQDRMSRQRERLLEENRKLRLEKASLESLRRVETIATRDLGLQAPAAARVGGDRARAHAHARGPGGQGARALDGRPRRGRAELMVGERTTLGNTLLSPPPSARERLVRLRLMLVTLSACLWVLVIMVRLVQLQVLGRAFFERQAARQSERTINLDPRRGAIVDRNGHPLAVSVDAESIYAVPQDIEDAAGTATALGKALSLDAGARRDLQAQLEKTRAFVWVRRKVDPAVARDVRALQLDGVGFLTENRRYYPQRELAAHVIGYVGLDNTA